jgi:plastocyanin domain-containing protein
MVRTFIALSLLVSATALAEPPAVAPRKIALTVTDKGFEPTPVKVNKGEPLELVVTRKTEKTCATEIVVKGYDLKKELPLGKPVTIAFTPTKGGELSYGCAMGMINGVLMVE